MKFSSAALVSTFFRHFLLSGTILFSTKNSDVLAASAGFRIWRYKVTRDGTHNHICIDAFRFIRLDGTIAIPIDVQVTLTGGDYGINSLKKAFNVNDRTGVNGRSHWCGWGHSDIIVTFAEEETFGSYKFIPHGSACTNDPQTWFIEGKEPNDPNWTHLSDEDHDCPLPNLNGYNKYDITTITSSTSSPTTRSSSVPTTNPSENPSLSSSPTTKPSENPSLSPRPTTIPSNSPSLSLSPTLLPSSNPSTSPSFTPPQLLSWYVNRVSNGTIVTSPNTNITAAMRVYYNMTYRNYSFTVLDPTCNETKPATGITVLQTSSNSTQADGFMNIAADLFFNATQIENNDELWVGDNLGGVVKFCLVANLWSSNRTDATNGKKITFDETQFRIDVDKTSNFTLNGITIERASAESVEGPDIDYEANLDAYQCDASLTRIDNPAPLSQKSNILSMCIQSNSAIQVSSIVSLDLVQRATSTFPSYKYQAIVNGVPENTALVAQSKSVLNEDRKKVVRVQVVLAATLFANPNPASIDASGTVALDVAGSSGTRTRHLLLDFESLFSSESGNKIEKEEGRLLQGDEPTEDFSLTAELAGSDSAGELSITTGSISTITGGALLAAMVLA